MFQKNRIVALGATFLALACGTAVAVQPPTHESRQERFQRGLEQLHGKLHLNGDQDKLWSAALDTMRQNRAAERTARRQMRQQFEAAQKETVLDLNAMHSAHENALQQGRQLREQTSAAWLNFYNALDTQQKTIVSTALKNHWARMAGMRAKWHRRHARMAEHSGAASAATAQ